MEIQEYLNQKRELQEHLLRFIESGKDYQKEEKKDDKKEDKKDDKKEDKKGLKEDIKMINFLEIQKFREIREIKEELQELLYLIAKISNNHRRNPAFFGKFEQILLHFEPDIKKNFTNSEIFNIFKINKRLLLFLIEKKFIEIDESIANFIYRKSDTSYRLYFFPEIKEHLKKEDSESIEKELRSQSQDYKSDTFLMKRKIGENDTFLCELIRKDIVEDFISHVNKNNISLTSKIQPSLFETNSFLLKKEPTIFEYSAFCGSLKIFQCLITNNIEMTSSLWLYSIHGENNGLIHLLEENNVLPEDASYLKCLEEAIKCHHTEIAEHIMKKYVRKEEINHDTFYNNPLAYAFHFFNYKFISNDNKKFEFFYACQFNYIKLVQLFLLTKEIDINTKIILNHNFFLINQV